MRRVSLILLWVALASTCSYRLPRSLLPEHYDLEIITNLADYNTNYDFQGKVWIKVNCESETQNITLHSKDLQIDESKVSVRDVTSSTPVNLKITEFRYQKENDFLIIFLSDSLKAGQKYEIAIPFTGKLEDSLAGYYKSSYTESLTNRTKWLSVTQFEATDARRAFPCFDEPAMKATFKISLGRNEKYSSISNMPKIHTEEMKGRPGWYWDRFEKTVPMSTYLIAFVVSDFDYKTSDSCMTNNVTFRIWSRKEAIKQAEFARQIGPKVLRYYEEFFNISYPLPKQDMIAIPDFSAGAMENWGLITYREALLLIDPDVSSRTNQLSVARVIAHELAHQWFGNLVTMKWWTDLWLNEGFATYMAGLAVHHVHPEWNSLEKQDSDNLLAVFSFDALESSHPVSVPIGHPREIDEIFDAISYNKGSSLIRMMGLFLGEGVLSRGVSNYLQKHKYSNAEQDDLWESLTVEAHSHKVLPTHLTVKEIMDTWTVQTGYPIVHVTRMYDKNTAVLRQERYISNTSPVALGRRETCWWIPISYTSQYELDFNNTQPKHWLSCTNEKREFQGFPTEDKWVIFNIQMSGIYRVNYDTHNWKLLINTLNSDSYKKIGVSNRVQLIDDSANLAFTNTVDYDIFFQIFKYLVREEEFLPWNAGLRSVSLISRSLKRSTEFGKFSNYMRKILTPIYEKIGGLQLPNSADLPLDRIRHQVLVTSWGCKFEVGNCTSEAVKMFKDFQQNPDNENVISKELRQIVYCTALKYGGEREWAFLWTLYHKSNVATEKSTILNALACTREIWILRRFLQWTVVNDSGVRKQDSTSVFASIAYNDVGYYVAKEFLHTQVAVIFKSLGPSTKRMSRFIKPVANLVMTQSEFDEFYSFTELNKEYFVGAKKSVEQALERAKLNVQWNSKHLEYIAKLLKQHV